jgi:hypothetical protein
MQSIQENMNELREQLKTGAIPKAYRALLDYMLYLRAQFKNSHPGYSVSGLYQGYLDMTYFAILPPSLKRHDLKVAIVFNYAAFRFEAWLAGTNRQVQRKVWELFRDSQWTKYRVVAPAKGVDAIIECTLAEDFDFSDLESMTTTIQENTIKFIDDVEKFISEHRPI